MLQAKFLKVKLLLAAKDYSTSISETGYILKEDENNLEALLLRGRAYYYLADHDVAQRFLNILAVYHGICNIIFQSRILYSQYLLSLGIIRKDFAQIQSIVNLRKHILD